MGCFVGRSPPRNARWYYIIIIAVVAGERWWKTTTARSVYINSVIDTYFMSVNNIFSYKIHIVGLRLGIILSQYNIWVGFSRRRPVRILHTRAVKSAADNNHCILTVSLLQARLCAVRFIICRHPWSFSGFLIGGSRGDMKIGSLSINISQARKSLLETHVEGEHIPISCSPVRTPTQILFISKAPAQLHANDIAVYT